jgi:3-oxoacyl-[acyl-carrier protein] reductase
MNDLTGKVAIVTGASKGIGAAVATALAANGAAVTVNYASDKDGADRTVAEITKNGGRAVAVQGDVAKATDVKRIFEETIKAHGTPNVLVNNAGTYDFEPIEAVTERAYRRTFDTNVLGTILPIQEALKTFPPIGGSIINISTIASENPVPNSSIYAASKGAIDTLTTALAKEFGPRRLRINTVAPGHTATEGTTRLGLFGSDQETALAAATPLGRLGQPADIAPVVVFLASDDAAWLTGERISASGGVH